MHLRAEELLALLKVAGVTIGVVFVLVGYDYLLTFDWSGLLRPFRSNTGSSTSAAAAGSNSSAVKSSVISGATPGKNNSSSNLRSSATHQRPDKHDVAAEKHRDIRRLAAEKAAQRQANNHQQSQERAAQLAAEAAAEAAAGATAAKSFQHRKFAARTRRYGDTAESVKDQMAHDWLT